MLKKNLLLLLLILIVFSQITFAEDTFNPKIIGFASGNAHSLFLKNDNTVWACGANTNGELGIGSTEGSTVPVQIETLNNVLQITAYESYNLALKDDGTVWAWGSLNGVLTDSKKILLPTQIKELSDVIQIVVGSEFCLCLKKDGTVWGWGKGEQGQLGLAVTTNSNTPVQIKELTNVIVIGAGYAHGLALLKDGTVWAWGQNGHGELGNGIIDLDTRKTHPKPMQVKNLTDVQAIYPYGYANFVIKNDGTVWCWGINSSKSNRLGIGTNEDVSLPVQIKGLTGIVEIQVGNGHCFAYKNDYKLYSWGRDNYLGLLAINNNTNPQPTPVEADAISGVPMLFKGSSWCFALDWDNNLYAWGFNEHGQLGIGNYSDTWPPKIVPNF